MGANLAGSSPGRPARRAGGGAACHRIVALRGVRVGGAWPAPPSFTGAATTVAPVSDPPPSSSRAPSPRPRFAESTAAADTHTHFGLLYESRAEQLAVAAPFIEEGLRRGERCVYARAGNSEREVREALRAVGVDDAAAVDAGALTFRDARELYLEDGEFSTEPMLAQLDELTAESTDRTEHAGLRMAAEVTWAVDAADDREAFLEYETAVNRVYPQLELVGLCQYDRTRLPADTVDHLIRTHPLLTVDESVAANPYYLAPDADRAQSSAHQPDQKLDMLGALQRRERGMTVLADATPQLMGAERRAIPDIVVATLREAFSLPVAGLWLYDRDADELRLRAAAGPDSIDVGTALSAHEAAAWHAYSTNETRTDADLREATTSSAGSALGSALFVPIGGHGVLCAAAPTTDAVDAPAVRVAEAVAANTEAALARAEHEQQLQSRSEELERYTTATRLLQACCRTVVDAATRADVEAAICERLAAFPDVRFAWIGTRDAEGDELTPRAWAGAEQGFLSDAPLGPGAGAPSVRTAATGEPTVVANIVDRVETGQWRTAALSRGFRSVMAIPLTRDDISHGTLAVYAAESGVFDDLLQAVLADLGRLVAYAIHFAEQTTALHEPTVQELEFEVTASNFPLLQLARHADCTLSVEGVLSADRDRPLLFVTVEGASRDAIVDAVDAALVIESGEVVREARDGYRVELTLSEPFVDAELADRGAVLEAVTADPTGARVVVTAPTTVAAGTVWTAIDQHYPDASLVARRQQDRSLAGPTALETRFLDHLTERQVEVLTAAYHAGYFESPRQRTGAEVADVLGITSQTFSQHLRRIERKLFDSLLTGTSLGDPERR